jgi:hypothetical protein
MRNIEPKPTLLWTSILIAHQIWKKNSKVAIVGTPDDIIEENRSI